LIVAEHVLQLLEHRRTHRIDFPDPPPVHGTDGEHTIFQLDGRGTRDSLTASCHAKFVRACDGGWRRMI
jgi:hypothetical protein